MSGGSADLRVNGRQGSVGRSVDLRPVVSRGVPWTLLRAALVFVNRHRDLVVQPAQCPRPIALWPGPPIPCRAYAPLRGADPLRPPQPPFGLRSDARVARSHIRQGISGWIELGQSLGRTDKGAGVVLRQLPFIVGEVPFIGYPASVDAAGFEGGTDVLCHCRRH